MTKKHFVAYYYCNGFDLNLGISIHFSQPNIEIHLPFGFIRIGFVSGPPIEPIGDKLGNLFLYRAFGFRPWY